MKFAVPTVSGGKVFMGGAAGIDVYALLASTPQRLTAPTFSPAPSSYAGAQSVTITAAAGATIYYTLDGSQPTLASAIYTGPLNVAATTTINAIALQSGKLTSTPAVGVYTISSLAQISYVQGNYATPQSPQTSVAVKFIAAQQQGDLNVVVVAWGDSSATVKSVTDTQRQCIRRGRRAHRVERRGEPVNLLRAQHSQRGGERQHRDRRLQRLGDLSGHSHS